MFFLFMETFYYHPHLTSPLKGEEITNEIPLKEEEKFGVLLKEEEKFGVLLKEEEKFGTPL